MASAAGQLVAARTVVLASADAALRQRLRQSLTGLRWQVREAAGGAEAIELMERARPEVLLVDSWLPDLEVGEFSGMVRNLYPAMDLLRVDGVSDAGAPRSPRRNELLHALREAQEDAGGVTSAVEPDPAPTTRVAVRDVVGEIRPAQPTSGLADMVGTSDPMLELGRMIRLVAPRSTTVLIEGETGTGKEVVAKAVHRLSLRSAKSFTVLNCAAIPESLLEAELFGHTRGAFTGAVQSRTGRIEAAHGGTLFLDEIGEMPLALQAKMLRFLECGELQRVGDNEVMRVDVRVTAAVVINDRQAAEGAGKTARTVWKPRSADEMKRLEQLAQAAVGFDERRGDQVVMSNVGFTSNAPEVPLAPMAKLLEESKSFLAQQPSLMRTAMMGFIAFCVVLFVLRPVANQISAALKAPVLLPAGSPAGTTEVEPGALPPGAETAGLPAPDAQPTIGLPVLPIKSRATLQAQAIFDHVSQQVAREPAQSTRLLEVWLGSQEGGE